MSILNKIKNLPIELENIIYNIYWTKKYSETICHLKMLNKYHDRIHSFLTNHFLATRIDVYDNLHYHFLEEINKMLVKIINDKSSFLYLIGKDVYMKTIKTDSEISYLCKKNISSNLRVVAIYSINISDSYYFDHTTFERFKKLSNIL